VLRHTRFFLTFAANPGLMTDAAPEHGRACELPLKVQNGRSYGNPAVLIHMAANRVLNFIITVLAWIVAPIQIVTTFALGLLVRCSFGLLLLPLSLVWNILLFPLIGASWFSARTPFLRNAIGFIGLPWALVAHTYSCLTPSMGEFESRAHKLLITEAWPFCWEYWQFARGRLHLWSPEGESLSAIVDDVSRGDPIKVHVIDRLALGQSRDA
jgi:hypothetical protein